MLHLSRTIRSIRYRRRRILRLLLILYILLPMLLGGMIPPRELTAERHKSDTTIQPADTLTDWEVLQMAIAFTESRFRPDAKGKAMDYGVYQITPIYVKEINRLSGYEAFQHEEALDVGKSVQMFNAMQTFKNPEHDIERAIHFHNKSPYYRKTVLENYDMVLRYETLRKTLKSAQ